MKTSKTVDQYILTNEKWQHSLLALREILLSTELVEIVKWGSPVYTINEKNVIGLGAFKNYVSIWFFQGALLLDKNKKLINAQEGVTKALRQWRFVSEDEILENIDIVKQYLEEAIVNQKMGKEVKIVKDFTLNIPHELMTILNSDSKIKRSFETFSIARRREFCKYIIQAKRTETKQKRLEKIIPMIMEGIGMNDKYRK